MNPLNVIRDALYFFQRNLGQIVLLCLPLVLLESIGKLAVTSLTGGTDAAPAYDMIVGLLFYPLYTGALILFLDARSHGEQPRTADLWAMALRLWPGFALLAALSTLLIMLGVSMFVLPGLWVMVKLVFAEYLFVLRGLAPLAAMRESFQMSNGHFWRILACVLGVLIPLWLLDGLSLMLYPQPQDPLIGVLIDCANSFLQVFTTVVLFRLFMLIDAPRQHP
ncbi:hypothetical protein NPS46_22085 [Pseudomonas putida]|uniref:hypothetical protein n=1 Tax=Pseudomonas putida TaxID=303 RepID=UPI002363EECF|nr:hypothetical protein [Pseudomonas putida]MDD2055245.1 hypothetical protein [Pseudomonas putida]